MPSRKRHASSPRKRAASTSRWTLGKRLLLVLAFLVVAGQGYRSGPSPAIQAQGCNPLLSNEVVCENALPGNADWDIGTGAGDPSLQGFATDISVDQGETVRFKIDSAAPYRMHIYRLGYYGGAGGRKVAVLPSETGTFPAQAQLACVADQNTGLVDCGNWTQSASWAVPADAVSGVYVARLERPDTGGGSHIHFVVRDDDGQSDVLFQTSDTTWQAYNDYGGNSLYSGASHLGGWRAVAVSYNRPMNTRSVDPRSFFFSGEYPMLRFLEANGYDVSYFTGVDTDRRGAELLEHKVFLSVGHDEYWSGTQRANVEAARDATPPVHLAFFSGNEVFWKTRWENDVFGASHRTLVSYKETHANGKIDPAVDASGNPIWTGTWRDNRFGPHDGGRPENALTGTAFTVNDGFTTAIRVPAADGALRFWRNTPNVSTLTTGAFTLAQDTLGFEWDEDLDNGSRPAGLIRLSSTTATVPSKLLDNGSNYGSGVATHSMTLHRRASGALVFGAGTVQFAYGLSNVHDGTATTPSVDMQQATVNLFADMGVQPATLQSGLQPAAASTDTTRPTSVISSPANGATLTVGTPVVITGTAADVGGAVAAVEVSMDNGATWRPAAGRGSWSFTWTPTVEGPAVIRSRASDDSANVEIASAGITVDVDPVAPPTGTGPFSLFNNGTPTGAVMDHFDFSAVELGVRFRSDVSGFITGIKFYKIPSNGGTHRGKIYNNAGTELGSVTFTSETASGWQEAVFDSPIPINANTPYVASYHMPAGQYVYTPAYFGAAEYTNTPLHAYQDGNQGGNGIYAYGAGAFPTNSFNATNYWVDLVFVTSLPADEIPPTVADVQPADLAAEVDPTTNVRVTFSESMDPASISASTVMLRDAANVTVPATLTYSTSAKLATLNPATSLDSSATYNVLVKGGAAGVKDVSGNPMAADFQSSFVTKTPLPDPTSGPGGPILLITQGSNHYTKYYAEILRAEGLNQFTVADISTVNTGTLASHNVVLLAEMPLTPAQVTMFSNWVIGGGKLIAMRPDKQLASLLGLTDLGASHANEYLLVDTTGGPGQGIVGETIQYHGTADDYALNGATSIAELYSDATTPSGRPGVTWRAVGAGVAAAFTYDLSRSVLLTRQGNPAWSGQDRDGFPPIRADDLFYGNATIAGGALDANGSPLQDPQPDWIDLNKVAIPQADEQMRLLANMIHHMSPMPVPRFWYFPHGKKAVVVMTGDDHNSGGTAGRFSIFTNDSPAGCSVADWTCIRSTSYIYAGSIDDTAASNFADNGFEISLHLNTGCNNWTPTSLRGFFNDQLAGFAATYPSLEAPSTHRIHCLVWSDYSTLPIVSLENGIRLDTSYYYWPSAWVQDRPGFFTGSGIPMRHAKVNGEIIDVYQADTKMTDESGQSFPFTPNQLFTKAIGPEGYYGAFTANMHTDSPTSDPAQGILDEALPRGIPIVSAKQMLDWLDGRNSSSFGGLTWDGTTLGFTIVAGPSTRGLEAMLPTTMPGSGLTLVTVRRNGVVLPIIRTETIKGVSYAFVEATTGAYQAVYDNGGAPVITAVSAAGTAQGGATFSWQTNEASSSRVQYGTSPASLTSEVQSSALVTSHSLQASGVVGGTTYYYRVTSVDGAGQSTTAPPLAEAPASFVMPGPIVTAADVTTLESAGNAAITLQLSNVAAQDVVVTFATSDGTATAGTDYTATAAGTATISAGSTSVVANVPVLADAQDEPNETFVVSFTGATNATLGTTQVTVTIDDDDDAPSLSIADVTVVEGNAGVSNAVFTVSLSASSALPVSVDFATADDTALAGGDYVASSGQLVIPAGQASGQIVVPVVGDLSFEAAERFSVTLSNASNATIAQAQAFGTITNDDTAPTLAIGDVTIGEAGGNAAFTVTLSEASGANVTVDFATADGTALAGSDYTAGSGSVTIPAGSTTGTINVAVLADPVDEADETFTVTLSNPQNATILDGSATATITDDDAMPSLSIGDVSVTEGQSGTVNAVFTVSLSAASGQAVSVDVATADGTATAAADYTAGNATLSFAAGQTSKVFEVVVTGDRLDEADENFVVNLTNAVNATIADAQATGTITDDDAAPVAVEGTATTNEDAAVVIDVLANVTDGDGDSLTLEAVGQGTHGAVAIITTGLEAGKVSYTPNADFFGSDTFTFTVSDGHGNKTTGAVTVTVTSVNDAPVANDDAASVAEDSGATAIDVKANDSIAPDTGETLTVTAVTQGTNGAVAIIAAGADAGKVSYTPNANFVGADTFSYTVSDGNGGTDTATVSITVTNVNDAPVANDDAASVAEDSGATAIDVLANDTDADGDTRTITAVTQGANGAVAMTGGGTGLTYAPNSNFVGTDSFTYTISDGNGGSDSATVSITVTNVNDAPVANDDAASVAEDSGATAIDVLANDTDADGDTLSISGVTQGANGAVVITGAGTGLTYAPNANFVGSDSFTYTVSDGNGGSDTATISITVTSVNDAPVANADTAEVAEDSAPTAVNVLANDTIGPDTGETLSITAVTQGTNGSVVITGGGTGLTYAPNANFNGSDSFSYTIGDGNGGTATATVSVTVTGVNDAPVANDDAATVAEDSGPNAITVLANDTDVDGDTRTITAVTQGANGAVVITGGGTGLTYAPNGNFVGADSFTYTISDGNGGSDSASVSITVTAVNDAPVAANDTYSTNEDVVLTVLAPGVLSNDSDVEAASLTAALVAGPANGTLELSANGSFTYTPNAQFSGNDSFTYRANDGSANSEVATVSITVVAVNDAPVANDDAATVAEDSGATAINVRANDTDADSDTLSISGVTQGANGAVVITGGGTGLTYAPNSNFVGTDSFTYTISDGNGGSDSATVSITVTNVNDAPVANDDAATVAEDSGANAIDVLANDTDGDGDTRTITAVTQGTNGSVVITGGGTGLTYAPNANFVGSDSFSYTISDGNGGSDSATVSITVTNVNDAPVANDDAATVAEDSGANAIPVLANDTDGDGDTRTITAVTQGTNGAVVITGGGTGLTYAPNANFAGADSFTYTISDGKGGSDSAAVSITVTGVNDAPVAAGDSYTTNEDVLLTVLAPGVLSNDSDLEGASLTAALVAGPANGTLELNANGSFTYMPNAQFSGNDSFTYRANDGSANSEVATVSITVVAVNDAPVANDDAATVAEDSGATAINVLANDTDGDGDTRTITAVTQGTNGAVVITGGGTGLTYAPNANFAGADSFTYTISDGNGGSDSAAVSITVTGVNDAPVAASDSYTTNEDVQLTVLAPGVLSNDSDVEGASLTAALVAGPANGTLELSANGAFTYMPNAQFSGSDSFTYRANDGSLNSNTATVSITVTAVNDAPLAAGDSYSTTEDVALNIAAPGVLSNDSDTEGASLTAVLASGPANGTLALNANGSFTYTPNAQFSGSDSFSYRANDGSLSSEPATVSITVTAVNDAPVANDDAATVAEDSGANAINVLANDTDGDGDTRTITAVTQGTNGAVVITGGGTGLTYAPNANFAGSDSFTYTISDGNGGSDSAAVSITVTGVNDAPVAASDSYTTNEDVQLTVLAPGVLSNDSDVEGASLTAALVAGPANGTLELSANGAFTYMPNAQFSGNDSFTYRANEGSLSSEPATVSITVTAVNDAPVANDDAATVAEDSGATAINVLANDTDGDGDTRTITAVTQGTNGAVVITGGGTGLTYAPNANFAGADSFTYTISDGNGGSDSAAVSITVTGVNDAPVAASDSYTTNEDVQLTVLAPGVLSNDSDVEGASLTAALVAGPANGTLELSANGAFTYMPNAQFSGNDSFTYRANDGTANSETATVSIAVTAVNDAPVANDDTATVAEDSGATAINVLANDTDGDGDTRTITAVTQGTNGAVVITGGGTGLTYAPNANFAGSDSFTYTIGDGHGGSDSATVSVTVTSVNDAPVAANNTYSTNQGVTLNVAAPGVLGNDTDVEGSTLTAVLVQNVAHGTLTLNANGSFTYAPTASYSGPDSFTYRANDGSANSNVATVSITVIAANQPPVAVNDSYTTSEDVALNVPPNGVLANDTDANANTLTAIQVSGAANGTVTLNANGSFTYTPNANFSGTDSFTYRANDGTVSSTAAATVTITVTAVNDGPIAADDTLTVLQNSAATTVNVLANDSNVEAGETLTITAVTQGAHGTVTINAGTSVRYTPAVGYSGPDSFTYTVVDGNGGSATATVSVTVQAPPSITITDVDVIEGNSGTTDATLTVSLSAATTVPVTVNYTTVDGGARAPKDYLATSGTLTFGVGETSKPLTLQVVGEITKERNEVFSVRLSSPTNATIDRTSGFVGILDDDSTPTTTLSGSKTSEGSTSTETTTTMSGTQQLGTFSLMSASLANSTSLAESPTLDSPSTKTAVFTITLTNPSEIPISVDYRTVDGTGVAGEDYEAVVGTLRFTEDETVKTIEVPIRPDIKHELDEALTIVLSNPVELIIGNSAASAVIVDDDPAPVIDVTDAVVIEGTDGMSQAVFTVTLASVSGKSESVKYSTTNGSAAAGIDYTPVSGELVFAPGVTVQQIVVPVAGDGDAEGDETFLLNLVQASDSPLARGQAVATIVNDDNAATPTVWTSTTMADFEGGTADATTFVTALEDGDIMLMPSIRAEFTGTALPAAWTTSIKRGGFARVADDKLSIDFATVNNTTLYTAGRSVEFVATFSGAVNQLAGFTSAQFIVKADGNLYARSVTTPLGETSLGKVYFGAPHRFRITWTAGRMQYEVDGKLVADHIWGALPTQMPLQFADLAAIGGGTLVLDWVRISPYAATGSYTSKVFDAGSQATWLGADATATLPAGTTLEVLLSTGDTLDERTWTTVQVVNGQAVGTATGRYARYTVKLNTTANTASPILHQVVVKFGR